ncbi:MAG TPA: SdpI family protein [Thermoanaerobaculia bacterium]|nr:SdpI family protein [Thermoanaerobaculia bacterium]
MKRISDLLGLLLVVASFALVGLKYPGLPDPMPSHWNAAGHVDGWLPKSWGAFLLPIVMAVIWLSFLVLPRISPRGFEMEPFLRAWGILKVTMLALMFFIGILVLNAATTGGELSPKAMFFSIGALFVVIGNLLGKVTRNFFVGIRTPWTLANEEVWYRTHRLGGKLFVVAGLFVAAMALLGSSLWPIFVSIALAGLIPIVYSYVIYRRLEGMPGGARPVT